MSQQRSLELIRQAAEALSGDMPVPPVPSVGTTTTTGATSQSVAATVRSLFAPYSRMGTGRRGASSQGISSRASTSSMGGSQWYPMPKGQRHGSGPHWVHRFCALACCTQEHVPTKEEKFDLKKAGLGEKKVTFRKNTSPQDFKDGLVKAFPKLAQGGGFELLRTSVSSRTSIQKIWVPPGGISSTFLADESGLCQALAYIRPIQCDLSLDEMIGEGPSDDIMEECVKCLKNIPMTRLRDHVETCNGASRDFLPEDDDQEDDDLPSPSTSPPRKVLRSIPTEASTSSTVSMTVDSMVSESKKQFGQCPVCGVTMDIKQLQEHANICLEQQEKFKTLSEAIAAKAITSGSAEKKWNIKVVRGHFLSTALEQIGDADDDDWTLPINVTFIGEPGIDIGGLSREFFTLLFKQTTIFEEGTFSLRPDLLSQKAYENMGKIVARAILSGHPGPCCLNRATCHFILKEEVILDPMDSSCTLRGDAEYAVRQIKDATTDTMKQVFIDQAAVLETIGFTKSLTVENREEAIQAIHMHYSLYRGMAPMLQFMNGLKLHGVLGLLQAFPEEGERHLRIEGHPTAEDLGKLYKATFSAEPSTKATEEIVVYNFHRFLSRVEKGKVSSVWLRLEEDPTLATPTTIINIGHVTQALMGCDRLPTNIFEGSIEFDHDGTQLTRVNTCNPSINFSDIKKICTYEAFEEAMLNVVVGAYGFGCV